MTFEATVAYPYVDAERATAALRGELRRQAAEKEAVPDWSSLTVLGPEEQPGAHNRTWYAWTATVRGLGV